MRYYEATTKLLRGSSNSNFAVYIVDTLPIYKILFNAFRKYLSSGNSIVKINFVIKKTKRGNIEKGKKIIQTTKAKQKDANERARKEAYIFVCVVTARAKYCIKISNSCDVFIQNKTVAE